MSRILLVAAGPFTRQIGGGQTYVQELALGLKARGHEIHVLEPDHSASPSGETYWQSLWQAVPVWSLGLPVEGESLEDQYSELGNQRIALVGKLLRTIEPDIVQINGLMPALVKACKNLAIPHLVVAHHPGEVCPKGDLLTPEDRICTVVPDISVCGPCVLRCKKGGRGVGKLLAKLPLALYRKAGPLLTRSNPLGYIGRVLYIPWLTEQKLRGLHSFITEAEMIVAPSRAMSLALIRAGADPARVKVIHHGIAPLQVRPIEAIESRPLRLGFVGRIDHAKGLHVLLDAMVKVQSGPVHSDLGPSERPVELHVYGSPTNGHDLADWEQVLKRAGHPAWLHLHGAFARADIEKVYRDIDVLVLPAICLESFGLVVAEALSAGRPVLTTDCGGPAEQIMDGENGWIVPANDPERLADKLRELSNDRHQVTQAGLIASQRVKDHGHYIDEIENLLFQRA